MNESLAKVCVVVLKGLGYLLELHAGEVSGSTGRLSQLQTSIINPSGSWKNSCSTNIPPSSTTRLVHLILLSFRSFSTCTISSHCTKQKDSYIHESSLLQNPTTTLTKEEYAVRDSWILQKTYNPLWKCKWEWHSSCDNNFNWVNTFPGSTSKNNTQYCSLTIWDICPTNCFQTCTHHLPLELDCFPQEIERSSKKKKSSGIPLLLNTLVTLGNPQNLGWQDWNLIPPKTGVLSGFSPIF